MGMGKLKKKIIEKQEKKYEVMDIAVFTLLCILIFFPPFFKGLYFEGKILAAHIVTFALFMMYLIKKIWKREKIVLNHPFDYIGILMIISYLLPILFRQWAHLRDAIGQVLRYLNLFMIYVMMKDYSKEDRYRNIVLNILLLSGFVAAMIGILAVCGYIQLEDAVLGNRISSTFQYPNTLAAFVMALFFLAVGRMEEEQKTWIRSSYGICGFVLFFTFIFTYSRGAWLIFPFFGLFYLTLISHRDKVNLIIYSISIIPPILFSLQPFTKYLEAENERKGKALAVFFLAVVLFRVLYMGLEKIKNKLQQKHIRYFYGGTGIMAGLALICIAVAVNSTQPLVLDNTDPSTNTGNPIFRTIKNICPNEEYILCFDVESTEANHEEWVWRTAVYSSDEEGQRQLLVERRGKGSEVGRVEFPFTTLEDTENIIVSFTNFSKGSKVIFDEAVLVDRSGKIIEEIKLSYQYIPEALVSRFHTISLREKNAFTRLVYYKDSLAMFRDHPIIGMGGGAWSNLYPKYQSQQYISTQAHNYYLQTLVETGLVGGILLLLFTLLLLRLAILYKGKERTLSIAMIIAALSLLGHSMLDFNFSYLFIPILLWSLVGMVAQEEIEACTWIQISCKNISPIGVFILMIPLLIGSVSFYTGYMLGQQAVEAIERGAYIEGWNLFRKAAQWDPYQLSYRVDLGELSKRIAFQENDLKLLQYAERQFDKAASYAPYHPKALQQAASFYISVGQFDKGFYYLENSIKAAPLNAYGYETKCNAYLSVGNYFLQNGQKETGLKMYAKAVEVVDDVARANEKTRKPIQLLSNTMNLVQRIRLYMETVDKEINGDRMQNVIYASYFDIDVDGDGMVDDWLLWEPVGSDVKTEKTENGFEILNLGEHVGGIQSKAFTLSPSTVYRIELQVNGIEIEKNLQVSIFNNKGEPANIQSDFVKTDAVEGVYAYILKTPEDLQMGKQYIQIEHSGNTMDKITINRIVIYEIGESF